MDGVIGITAYGVYIPRYRLSRDLIARAWGRSSVGGERAVANFDEDSVTMSVAAAIDCIGDLSRDKIDGLYFASTTSPYKEKQASAIIAAAIDLRQDILAADFTNSLRAGTIALKAAIDAVRSGSAKRILVTAADCRLGAAQGEFEQTFGDGAVAILIGASETIAEVEGSQTLSNEFVDLWRAESDNFIRSWEERFILTHGYAENVKEAVGRLLNGQGLTPKDFTKAAVYGPDSRNHERLLRDLGFQKDQVAGAELFSSAGCTGAAFALMTLVSALEEAKPGDRILLASYGDGADAYAFKVTEDIGKLGRRRGIRNNLAVKRSLPSYEKYLSFRQLITTEAARRPGATTSVPASWRDRKALLTLYGHQCKVCGTLQFPLERVCYTCQAIDTFDEVRLSDKTGEVITYTKDYLFASPNPPTIMVVVELQGGCRLYVQFTDSDDVKIGMPIEMTFRKLHEGGGIHNYFWKAKPIG